MIVKATKQGFYGNQLRKEGEEFELDEIIVRRKSDGKKDHIASKEATLLQFSTQWMEWVEKPDYLKDAEEAEENEEAETTEE